MRKASRVPDQKEQTQTCRLYRVVSWRHVNADVSALGCRTGHSYPSTEAGQIDEVTGCQMFIPG